MTVIRKHRDIYYFYRHTLISYMTPFFFLSTPTRTGISTPCKEAIQLVHEDLQQAPRRPPPRRRIRLESGGMCCSPVRLDGNSSWETSGVYPNSSFEEEEEEDRVMVPRQLVHDYSDDQQEDTASASWRTLPIFNLSSIPLVDGYDSVAEELESSPSSMATRSSSTDEGYQSLDQHLGLAAQQAPLSPPLCARHVFPRHSLSPILEVDEDEDEDDADADDDDDDDDDGEDDESLLQAPDEWLDCLESTDSVCSDDTFYMWSDEEEGLPGVECGDDSVFTYSPPVKRSRYHRKN